MAAKYKIMHNYERTTGDAVVAALPAELGGLPACVVPDQVGIAPVIELEARNADMIVAHNHLAKELASKNRLLEAVLSQAGAGFYIAIPDGKTLLYNQAMQDISGYTQEEVNESGWFNLAYSDESDRSAAVGRAAAAQNGHAVAGEWQITTKNGTKKWVKVSISPIELDGQNYNFGRTVDITSRKQSELALRRSEERFRAMFESSPVGMGLTKLDGTIISTNPALEKMVGYAPGELIGRTTKDITLEEDLAAEEGLLKVLLTKERDCFQVDKRYVHKDGRVVWGQLTVSLVDDPETGQKLALGIVKDVGEARSASAAFRESESRYRGLLGAVDAGIIAVDTTGRVTHMNDRARYLHHFNDLNSAAVPSADFDWKLIDEAGSPIPVEKLPTSQVLATGKAVSGVLGCMAGEDGRILWQLINASPVIDDASGIMTGAIATLVDITERKRIEGDLRAHTEFGNLVSRISTRFISLPVDRIDEGINDALKAIGEFSGVDRSYLMLFSKDQAYLTNTHEWCAEGVTSEAANLQALPVQAVRWIASKIQRREVVHVPRVADMPPEAAYDREEVLREGIQSFLEVPMIFKGDVIGYAGYDSVRAEKTWSDETVLLLSLVSNMVVGAMARRDWDLKLRASEEKFREIFQNVNDGLHLYELDSDGMPGRFIEVNDLACQRLGYTREELLELRPTDIIAPDYLEIVPQGMSDLLRTGRATRETAYTTKSGTEIPLEVSLHVFDYQDRKVVLSVARDISDRKIAEDQIRYMSFHDKLTGLYNRAYMEEEMDRLDTARQLPLSVIMGDVNGLKLVNDSFGHATGDELLRHIGAIMKNSCRAEDAVSRWGGDEFVIILPRTSERAALSICKRIQKACEDAATEPIPLSVALGTVTRDDLREPLEYVLKEAEDRMYRRKLVQGRSARSSAIDFLRRTLAARSYETDEHTRRMENLAVKLGATIGMVHSELDEVKLLAGLHDIGKIAVPDEIIMKSDKLTPSEWSIMKAHPETGYRIAMSSPELASIAPAILNHHEWWDGTGYPQGLAGEQISLAARILAIVDAYDAMTNDRPYHNAISHDQAIAELIRCSGTQFDPDLVDAFVGLFEK